MEEQGLHQLRQAADALVAAVAELDLTDASPAVCQELWSLGDQLEARTRAMAAQVAARLPDASASDRDGGPDELSHPLRRVESC